MKKFIITILLFSLFLSSCGNDEEPSGDTTSAPDWRNSIEYEGSFYVEKGTKLLYALDTGIITLWDNGGDGSVLQTLEYDTTAQDAIDRMETDDVNGDGFADIRTVFSEKDGKTFYNLWLWSPKEYRFAECRDYRFIASPQISENGTVSQSIDNGMFGIINSTFAFDGDMGISLVSYEIPSAAECAQAIAAAICPGQVKESEGKATIDGEKCRLFTVSDKESVKAYITYDKNGEWYCDMGCKGLYRNIDGENGNFIAGPYAGVPGTLLMYMEKFLSDENLDFVSAEKGKMGSESAVKYTLSADSAFVVVSDKGKWYFSSDGEKYSELITDSRSGECRTGDDVDFTFAIPEEKEN